MCVSCCPLQCCCLARVSNLKSVLQAGAAQVPVAVSGVPVPSNRSKQQKLDSLEAMVMSLTHPTLITSLRVL